MTFRLEYHKAVQRSILPSLALCGMLLLPLLLPSHAFAQINGAAPSVTSSGFGGHAVNGTPPSVTSPGFGGRAINGTPPSVTSLGRNGFAPPNSGFTFHNQLSHSNHHHHRTTITGDAYYPYVYALPVPYAVDLNQADAEDDDSDYQGGPTIFDRRGSGRDSYIPTNYPGPAHARETKAGDTPQTDDAPASVPETPQPSTLLIFKDGHQLEVGNYAIVSQTLYDLTPGRPRKIALADLDLSATQKQNDDRGVTFQPPPSVQAN